MGIVSKGGHDYLHAQYFSLHEGIASTSAFAAGLAQKNRTIREGILVRADQVFISGKMPETQSSLKAVISYVPDNHKQPTNINEVRSHFLKTQ